ncbi:GntR family transcriptional regulator [Pusillimonas sp. T7-7]|uniref:FadR/GntR family transcriptional regulator n=1 Tax=Pusillimonas sp. (strain T7-7) TaxID=1007105 RepID=UPI0002084910|nr:FadR/GntR family transcriptional regulator [Pusillimonas sp. T7-7]AEC21629.1 GntR family transcriptional regulator [Pusillimonas sp. T7-7]
MSIQSTSLVKQVAQQLQIRIRQKKWSKTGRLPGQRQLAEELGVSRASLREAITMLEGLGLLRSEAGRGVFIADPRQKGLESAYGRWSFQGRYALRDVYMVRAQLEELAVMLAANVVTESGLDQLRDTIVSMQTAANQGDLVAMAEADQAFHERIFEIAGSPLLTDIVAGIENVIESSRQVAFANPDRVVEPIQEHACIVDALASGSPALASKAMREHLHNVADRSGVRLLIPAARTDDSTRVQSAEMRS